MFRRILCLNIILSVFLFTLSYADTTVFEKTFAIEHHHKLFSINNFHAADPGGGTLVIIKNQPGKAIKNGYIRLNGRYFHLKHFLKSKEQVLHKDITVKASNRLIVSFQGRLHSSLSVVIKRKGSPPPTVKISANPTSINAGEASALTWSSTNATTCSIDQGIGTVAVNGTQAVSPTQTTTYTITATGAGGTATESATVTVAGHISVTITSPTDGSSITGDSILVRGTVTNGLGKETGIVVYGKVIATVFNNEFVANNVPLTEVANTINVIAADSTGVSATKSVTINADREANHIRIKSYPGAGISPLEVTLNINGSFTINNPVFTYVGPGNVERIASTNPDEYKFRITAEGIYYITAEVTGPDNIVYQDTVSVTVLSLTQIDALFRSQWQNLTDALQRGDKTAALNLILPANRAKYQMMFDVLGDQLPAIVANYTGFNFESIYGTRAYYKLETTENGRGFLYQVVFIQDQNGLWCIEEF